MTMIRAAVCIYLKNFTKKIIWIFLFTFAVAFSIGCYLYVYSIEPLRAVNQMVYGQAVLTYVLMMIGIEIKRLDEETNLDELYLSYLKNKSIVPLSQITVIGILGLAASMFIAIFCLLRMLFDGAGSLWIISTLKTVGIFYLIPCLIFGEWGLLIGQINRSRGVYLPASLLWLATSSLSSYFLSLIPQELSTIKSFFNMINLGFTEFQMYRNVMTISETEIPRWMVRILFLMILTAYYFGINIKYKNTGRKKLTLSIITVCSVVLLIVDTFNYKIFFERFANPTDSMKYVMEKSGEIASDSRRQTDISNDKLITVQNVSIDIACSIHGIKATVSMNAIQNKSAKAQVFTLYSDLVVDNITINGESVKYVQEKNRLTVLYNKEKRSGDRFDICFDYHGYSLPGFPANESTVQLNRAFPWFPWAGYKQLADYNDYIYNETNIFFIADWQKDKDVEYILKYNGPGNLYCNLEMIDENTYKGISDSGVSVYSGMEYIDHEGIDVWYPAGLYRDVGYAADALISGYEILENSCLQMGTPYEISRPEEIILVQMRVPVVYRSPQELYCYGQEWEIRYRNESSAIAGYGKKYENSKKDYIFSEELNVYETVSLLLNPCVGYPEEVSGSTTQNFAALLGIYLSVHNGYRSPTDSYIEYESERLMRNMGLNEEELEKMKICMEELAERMQYEDYDEQFKQIYHELIACKKIDAEYMIHLLYGDEGMQS